MTTFSDILKSQRLARNLTQTALGQIVGCRKSTVSQFENGRNGLNMTFKMAIKICRALDMDIQNFALYFPITEEDQTKLVPRGTKENDEP